MTDRFAVIDLARRGSALKVGWTRLKWFGLTKTHQNALQTHQNPLGTHSAFGECCWFPTLDPLPSLGSGNFFCFRIKPKFFNTITLNFRGIGGTDNACFYHRGTEDTERANSTFAFPLHFKISKNNQRVRSTPGFAQSAGKFIAFERGELSHRPGIAWQIGERVSRFQR
jgi:hypothetical protein